MHEPVSAALARARAAVAIVFLLNGFVLASWAAHIPMVKARLGIGESMLGWLLLMMALGAVIAFPTASFLTGRFGSKASTAGSAILLALALPLPVLSSTPGALGAALLLFGAANGALDVCMNAQAVAIETRYGRPILSALHALFSLGGMFGAGAAAIFFRLNAAPAAHALAMSALCTLVLAGSVPFLLPVQARGAAGQVLARPQRMLFAVGVLAFLGLLVEGSMADWSALYLHEDLGAETAVAAAAFGVFSLAMAAGRFAGDALVMRLGERALLQVSAMLAAAGLAAALAVGDVFVAMTACAAVGFGVANVIPILFRSASRTSPEHPERALAAVTTMGYLGLLAGPPLIGMVAGVTSLPAALGLVALACALIALLGGRTLKGSDPGQTRV